MLKLKVLAAMVLFFPAISWGASCEQLKSLYDDQDKHIALINVRGIGDDSAPRATLRQLQKLEHLLQKQMLLDFMTRKKCKFPDHVSSQYRLNAIKCGTQILKGNSSHPDCDKSKWESFLGG